ncbi:sugar phosphate isomerase/epimerase family protein [Kushneria indalinina]|uniref:Sugar phosphate isomerase/epimerase n=1 Tax=Kushneria indalinina DSM 14324 TaxID=1122140 RepID=A0A3D9DXC6_9GAMM|nr:TIM barrel protein [Kushneria indalinina]REC95351.1 sugar phosphate isomerase/epimerase [Kushneria indalinina DSM 14324]
MNATLPSAEQMRDIGMAVSTAAWDGYDWPDVFASMARLNIADVELAFIKGYVNEFTDADLNTELAEKLRELMAQHGQRCTVLSAHIDLGEPGAAESMAVRIRFAAALGARYLISNAASLAGRDNFEQGLDHMMAAAREAGIKLLFENPGDGSDNLINQASELPGLLERLDTSATGINYDPGNLISHRPALSPVEDALEAIPLSDHLHLKAVSRQSGGYHFDALGTGDIDYAPIVAALAARGLPFSLELPFRLRRDENAQPDKRPEPLPLEEIENGVAESLHWMAQHHPGL